MIAWDDEDDPQGNIQHIGANGLSIEEVEQVLQDPFQPANRQPLDRATGRLRSDLYWQRHLRGLRGLGDRTGRRDPAHHGLRTHARTRRMPMHPRTRRALEAMPPETRAAAEAAIARSAARRATPEGQAEQEEVIRKVREEFPPLVIDPELAKALSALRAERERQGLSLSEVSERSGIDRATISRLETGKVPNPTVSTLRALVRALNKRLSWSLIDEPASVGR